MQAAGNVRPVTADDAAAIVALIDLVAEQDRTVGLDSYPGGPEALRRQISGTSAQVASFLLAEHEGHIAGYLFVNRYPQPALAHVGLLAVAVHPEHRRAGLGRALLAGADAWAASVAVEKMTLSVLDSNRPAVQLFSSCGYAVESRRLGQFRIGGKVIDEVLMAKWLP